jgi:hypothetical protein
MSKYAWWLSLLMSAREIDPATKIIKTGESGVFLKLFVMFIPPKIVKPLAGGSEPKAVSSNSCGIEGQN